MSTDGLQNAEKIRILVLGDSGVGKTSLVELVCSGTELRKPRSTVGCTIHMKIHESRSTGKHCFVEFWDIGGSERFKESRHVFYTATFDGILFVYDLANSVSRRNLEKWKHEWQQVYFGGGGTSVPAGGSHSPRGFQGGALWGDETAETVNYLSPHKRNRDLQSTWSGGAASRGSKSLDGAMPPALTVGNKQDLVSSAGAGAARSNCEEIEGGQACHEVAVAARSKSGVAGHARDYQTLCLHMDAFFDRVLENKEQTSSMGVAGMGGTYIRSNSTQASSGPEHRSSSSSTAYLYKRD